MIIVVAYPVHGSFESTLQCLRWQCQLLYSVDYISAYGIIKQNVSWINRLSFTLLYALFVIPIIVIQVVAEIK